MGKPMADYVKLPEFDEYKEWFRDFADLKREDGIVQVTWKTLAGPMKLHDVSDTLKATGFTSIEYKGVTVNIPRLTPSVTHNGWIGPDHPETATEEWGRKMLQTTADYIVDFMEEFKKVDIAKACGTEF